MTVAVVLDQHVPVWHGAASSWWHIAVFPTMHSFWQTVVGVKEDGSRNLPSKQHGHRHQVAVKITLQQKLTDEIELVLHLVMGRGGASR